MIRAALIQLSSSDDPEKNLPVVTEHIRKAKIEGASFVLTPEVTNCVSSSRTRQNQVLQRQEDDKTLAELRLVAQQNGIWILIGSLALKSEDTDGRFLNRSFLIGPDGDILAAYDKINMFDVELSKTETYHESSGYRPGDKSVLCHTPFAAIGMTICYDVRFPLLYRILAQSGAGILTVPSAFSSVTGPAHWENLLRARAIETGSYILAPAQTGIHKASGGRQRKTYGHSLAVSPWGEVIADAESETGVTTVNLDMAEVTKARERIPAIYCESSFSGPQSFIQN